MSQKEQYYDLQPSFNAGVISPRRGKPYGP